MVCMILFAQDTLGPGCLKGTSILLQPEARLSNELLSCVFAFLYSTPLC